ncbi:MAG TPA: glycosyltransferase [Bacteroidales bacterium]|nr:glycosyltransferase [Bacteroidales bacterium]
MSQDKMCPRVLVAPLDWGLGHATRCIPVINELIHAGFEVMLGTSGKSGTYLKDFFPELQCIDLPFLKIRYGTYHSFPWYNFQLFQFPFITIREHFFLRRLSCKLHLDLIISDNRYGLYHQDIYSVIITHQLFIRLPAFLRLFQKMLWKITGFMLSRFDECWIPDLPDSAGSLSNELSHGKMTLKNYRYVGLLSRYAEGGSVKFLQHDKTFDLLVILSGPEPQRTIFENVIMNQTSDLNIKSIIFRGLPSAAGGFQVKDNITLIDYPDDEDFITYARQAEKIICRSGYSTIMDLISLKLRALLVPTPGQTEQIYLARHLAAKNLFLHMPQKEFNMRDALSLLEKKQVTDYPDLKTDGSVIRETVSQLMNTINRL